MTDSLDTDSGLAALARAVKDKNRTIKVTLTTLVVGLISVGSGLAALNFWNHHDDTVRLNSAGKVISEQRDIIARLSQLTQADRTLYCAQGSFLSGLIHTSLQNPSSNTTPAELSAVQGELVQLDTALRGVCP